MDADFQEKLKNVLSDPEALAKISAIASSLGASPTAPEKENTPVQSEQEIKPASANAADSLSAFNTDFLPQQSDPRLALLYSLKPLLREDKRERIDALTRALTVASMMKNFRK